MVYCSLRKACMGLPSLLAFGIISYISYTFLFEFLPLKFKDNQLCFLSIFLHVTFTYFSGMTYLHLTRCLLSDPGYIPTYLKAPLKMPEKLAPAELVRIYNMRAFEHNNIYSFDNLLARTTGDVGGDMHTESTQDEDGSKFITENTNDEGIEMSELNNSGTSSIPKKSYWSKNVNFKVDMENLNTQESRAFNMADPEWQDIESDILDKFPARTSGLVTWRYCFKCKSIRPPRSHHCAICGICVMRMDHHCPWVGNCVGLNNHKYFLNFLFHALVGCAIASITMVCEAFEEGFRKFDTNVHFSATMMLSTALIFSLGGLLGLHSYLIMTN